jgi:hypothetical protein
VVEGLLRRGGRGRSEGQQCEDREDGAHTGEPDGLAKRDAPVTGRFILHLSGKA